LDKNLAQIGFELDESSLDSNEERIRLERAACMNDYPELFMETRELVADIRGQRRLTADNQ